MPAFQLVINVDDRGGISVSGPIHQTVTCLGLLEVAKDHIKDWAKEQQKKVQAATLGDVTTFARRD